MYEPNQNVKDSAVIESEVKDRYAKGSQAVEPALCCPIADYNKDYLKVLPAEIVERDYGCGDPSKYVNRGDVAIDLGSGAGKICYIMSQIVGESGSVIGVDFNPPMLELAKKYQAEIAQKIGFDNVQFVMAKIQDMKLDMEKVSSRLQANPVTNLDEQEAFEAFCTTLRQSDPLIADETADVVVSNCVLNLVKPQDKQQLFDEIYRVLKDGGRAVISDIVCDEPPTDAIRNDPHLWSGCIAGAFLENEFLEMFEDAGFHGVEILGRQVEPWQTIDGIEFRSMTVRAWKRKEAPCLDRKQAVVYQGPWKQVSDEDGHVYLRGERMAVCEETFNILTDPKGPYAGQFDGINPTDEIFNAPPTPFDCSVDAIREPQEMKGTDYRKTETASDSCCGPTQAKQDNNSGGCCG